MAGTRRNQVRQGFVDGLGQQLADMEHGVEDGLEELSPVGRLMDEATAPSEPKDPQQLAAQAQLDAFRASCQERGTAVREEPDPQDEDEVRAPRHHHRRPAKGQRR